MTATGRVAKVFLCEKGCRVESIWSVPTTCRVKLGRREECGLPLHRIGELPESVQRTLNPLKASKRSSGG
ncbi:MAG: hypothetical protein AB7V62_06455 [Thermoleophilia bacterium]